MENRHLYELIRGACETMLACDRHSMSGELAYHAAMRLLDELEYGPFANIEIDEKRYRIPTAVLNHIKEVK